MSSASNISKRYLTPCTGVEIITDTGTLLSGVISAQICEAIRDRAVVCLRNAFLDDRQQTLFAATLGELVPIGDRGILKISIDRALAPSPEIAENQKAAFFWHVDSAWDDRPVGVGLLNPRVLSPRGGHTQFANLYAAYEDLPEDEKPYLQTLMVVHSMEATQRASCPWPTYARLREWQRHPPRLHPLVWRHGSGRRSLLLGTTASHIEGMSLEEGRALLCRLSEWATQPRYVYSHKWRMGDVVLWDNGGTMHRVTPYNVRCGRLLHRTTLINNYDA